MATAALETLTALLRGGNGAYAITLQTCGERLLLKIVQTSKTSFPELAMPISRHAAELFSQLPHPRARSAYLIEHIRHILLAAGLLCVAQLRCISAGQQTLIPNQRHALVGDLVPLEVNLVVGTTCKRRARVRAVQERDLLGAARRGTAQRAL